MSEQRCTWFEDHPEALGEAVPPAHLATCEACRAQVEALERALCRGLAAREVPVPPALARRIEEAVAARYGEAKRTRSWSWALAVPLVAAAAAVVVYGRARGSAVSADVELASSTPDQDGGSAARPAEPTAARGGPGPTRAEIARQVARVREPLNRCRKALGVDRVQVHLDVSPGGAARWSMAPGSGGGPGDRCVLDALARVTFAGYDGPPASLEVPLALPIREER